MTRRLSMLLFVTILLAGCNLPQGVGPQTWIDAPLDGSTLPLAQYEIVFHAYAAGNPAAVELTINGALISLTPPPLDQPLVTVHYAWDPQEPGRYVLAARTQDPTGVWSEPDTHVVTIEGSKLTPTFTDTPTPTSTMTLTPTFTPSATIRAVSVFSNLRLSSNTFYRMDAIPTNVTITIHVDDQAGIKLVEIYFRLRDPNTGSTTEWTNEDMVSQGGGDYAYTLNRAHPSFISSAPKTMTVDYQIIVTHPDLSLTRSVVYSDITLKNH